MQSKPSSSRAKRFKQPHSSHTYLEMHQRQCRSKEVQLFLHIWNLKKQVKEKDHHIEQLQNECNKVRREKAQLQRQINALNEKKHNSGNSPLITEITEKTAKENSIKKQAGKITKKFNDLPNSSEKKNANSPPTKKLPQSVDKISQTLVQWQKQMQSWKERNEKLQVEWECKGSKYEQIIEILSVELEAAHREIYELEKGRKELFVDIVKLYSVEAA